MLMTVQVSVKLITPITEDQTRKLRRGRREVSVCFKMLQETPQGELWEHARSQVQNKAEIKFQDLLPSPNSVSMQAVSKKSVSLKTFQPFGLFLIVWTKLLLPTTEP